MSAFASDQPFQWEISVTMFRHIIQFLPILENMLHPIAPVNLRLGYGMTIFMSEGLVWDNPV